jgi:hypothetical protein
MIPFIKTLMTVIPMMLIWRHLDYLRAWGNPRKRLVAAFTAAFLWSIAFSTLSALLVANF